MVIVAPGMTAPEESMTEPLMVPSGFGLVHFSRWLEEAMQRSKAMGSP